MLAVNVEGQWKKIELRSVTLVPGTWHHDQSIGVVSPPASISPLPNELLRKWMKHERYGSRKVVTAGGVTIELREDGLSTEMVITKGHAEPVVVWRSGLENCHSLSVSPDDQFVAYICELNGVIVTSP